jgi:hypothetical protein
LKRRVKDQLALERGSRTDCKRIPAQYVSPSGYTVVSQTRSIEILFSPTRSLSDEKLLLAQSVFGQILLISVRM